jgi:hypothetical protein
MSRHWHRARLAGQQAEVLLNVCPGETFDSLEEWWLTQDRVRPRAQVTTVLATRVPASIADAWVAMSDINPETTLAHLSKVDRRRLNHALLDLPLAVVDSRGYSYAEVTAGGIPLDEIDPATMQSRVCPGLFLVGEILDVDGRLAASTFSGRGRQGGLRARRSRKRVAHERPSQWLTDHRHLLPATGTRWTSPVESGRNAIWLAEQGFQALAVDRNTTALDALSEEAKLRRLSLRTQVVDLEDGPPFLDPTRSTLIVVVHYLHRPLFPGLVRALRPGGVLVYETFTRAQAARGKPTNPAFLLQPGELLTLVRPLQVLASREGEFEGKMLASVVATAI